MSLQPRPKPLNAYSLAPMTGDEDTERFEVLANEQSEPEQVVSPPLALFADCPCKRLRLPITERNEQHREGDEK